MMMTEKELIGKIRELRQIQPRKDWVSLTKIQILPLDEFNGSRTSIISLFSLRYKPVLATVTAFGILFGIFAFSQNSLPGDILYSIKKLTERSQAVFVSEKELPKYNLEIANKRLDELTEIAQTNQVKKLAPAISEFQANISKAAESLAKAQNSDVPGIVSETKKIKENKEKIESSGIVIGGTINLDGVLLQMIEGELKDLEVSTLTDLQKEFFVKAVEDFKAGNYSEALEKIWLLSNSQK